jgi:3-phenylpropionate/cinnamic acid dioxygenase small subunit
VKGLAVNDLPGAGVEAFLHREAMLLDAGDLGAWLELFAPDGVYWVPSRREPCDLQRHVSIVYDDRARLTKRVTRLLSGKEYAQEPPSATCRQLSNLVVSPGGGAGELTVTGVMVVYEKRPNTAMQVLPGHASWRLRAAGDSYEIVEKRVVLLDLDRYFENLTFIL